MNKRNAILLATLAFVISLGFGAIGPILPYYLIYLEGGLSSLPEELGTLSTASNYAVEFGFMMSAFMLTRALLARYFGARSDKVGRKRIILMGSIFYSLIAYAYIMATSNLHLYLIRAFQGAASAMVWPVAEALLMDSVEEEKRGRIMALYMMTSNLAMMMGPAVGAGLYKIGVQILMIRDVGWALRFPFLGLAVISAISVPISFMLREVSVAVARKLNDPIQEETQVEPWVDRSIKVLYLMGLANGFAMGFSAPLMSIFIIQFISSDPAAIAFVMTISSLIGMSFAYPAGRLSDKIGRKPIVIVGGLTSRLSTLVVPLIKDLTGLTLVSTIRSVAFNSYIPSFRALQADLAPKSIRGKVFGTVQAMFNVGAMLGPVVGGYLYQLYAGKPLRINKFSIPGEALPFWVSALIGLISLALFALFVEDPMIRRRRGRELSSS